jgi:DNA-binding transcriptional MerR regulator
MTEIKRLYYTINQVSEILEESPSSLRYWIKYFDIVTKKNRSMRKLTEDNIISLRYIRYLIRFKMYSLPGAKNEFLLNNGIEKERVDLLEKEIKQILKNSRYEKKKNERIASNSTKSIGLGY